MSNTPNEMGPQDSTRNSVRRRFSRIIGVGAVAGLTLLVGGKVLAQGGPGGMGMMGGEFGHHGRHGGSMDPEKMTQFGDQRIRKALSSVNATDAQITQVQGIFRAAMGEMSTIAKEGHANRQAIGEALARPTIDRREIERLRGEQMRITDRRSQRMTQAMGDAAEALDPQQRVQLLERMKQHRGRGHAAKT